MAERKAEAKAHIAAAIERARGQTSLLLPSAQACEVILDGMLTPKGTLRKKPITFRENPLASVTHRMVLWHGSGGNLHGRIMASMDCAALPDDARALFPEGMKGSDIFDILDNLALLMRGGTSPAASAWKRALTGE